LEAEMNKQIAIESELVCLRHTTENDLDFVLRAEYDPENSPFILCWTRDQHEIAFSNQNLAHLTIESAATGELVGYAILAGLENPNQSVNLQRLVITNKGKGYGKATVRLIKQWVFEELEVHRLWLDLKDYNHRAKRVYESAGFVEEGTTRECLKVGEKFESLVIMSVLRKEYAASKD
jgi:RimJ/RimL family protein N-acetyltransferase